MQRNEEFYNKFVISFRFCDCSFGDNISSFFSLKEETEINLKKRHFYRISPEIRGRYDAFCNLKQHKECGLKWMFINAPTETNYNSMEKNLKISLFELFESLHQFHVIFRMLNSG